MASQGIPVIGPVLNKIIGTRNERFVKRYTQRVDAINALEPQMRQLTDADLRAKLTEFRDRWDRDHDQEGMIVDVFAVAREAMDRAVGIRKVFNPDAGFDPNRLSGRARELYDQTKSEMDALPVILPRTILPKPGEPAPEGVPDEGDRFLGNHEPIPGWQQIDIPNEVYEAVRELYPESRPPFRARPFDVQLIGGMVLAQGKIAEMKTGEGKTIVAPLATYLACVERQQVHVVTVNDYLVQRDRDWTFPFFRALGLRVGAIHPIHMQPEEMKRWMYRCEVVYGTTAEFGFDYLRDNMKPRAEMQVQRKRQFAIVDEVDSVLIDEARTPLIISGQAHEDQPRYELADKLARHLVEKQKPWTDKDEEVTRCKETIKGLEGDIRQARDKGAIPDIQRKLEAAKKELPELERERDQHTQYFEVERDRKQAHLTHDGIAEAQRVAGIGSFYVDQNMDVPHLLEQSLRAHVIYELDRDYVVMEVPDRMTGRADPSVVIVDVNTGRPMVGRQWSDGLHQAVEIKERVPVKPETQTVAAVTIQNFFKMYKRLAGMTGTADTEAQEFHDIYKLDVVSIPTNKPIARDDHTDMVFLRGKDKWDRIVDEIKSFHDVGRPILVGTTSVATSEMLSQMLARKHQIKHEVLNAKQHEREAGMIQSAGQLGAVMIATNMAGRGTDIVLRPISRETLLDHWLRRGLCSRTLTTDANEEELRENVYRKVAPAELGMKKREAEEMDLAELELLLLRHWAERDTWVDAKKIQAMDADALRQELDKYGRCLLHRIRWFESIEEMGGLHVIGTERHESRRIDNQLRGRSGRQGDQGSSRFYVALDDDLMKMFAGETTMKVLARMGMKEGDAIESQMLSKRIEGAQRKVEERNFQMRKNILEYDEVMEHQRQRFYGLRQRVIEGLDVKGLIFEFIDEAVADACDEYLDPDFPATCAAEYAKEKLDCSIMPDRLRGKERDEMEDVIRRLAKEDAHAMIGVTIGEYIPMEGSEVAVDFDSAGLVNWAKSRFGVELDAGEIREGGAKERRHVTDLLANAAERKIDETDLSGLEEYLEKDYGIKRLCAWAKTKFGLDVEPSAIREAIEDDERHPSDVIEGEARELYRQREVTFPVEFAMQRTMQSARQAGPDKAIEALVEWANRRFQGDLSPDELKRTPPQRVQERLMELSTRFVAEGSLDKAIAEAQACETDEALDAWLTDRFGFGLPDEMRFLDADERPDAVRARVENLMRTEMLGLERMILLEVLDQSWKDHLYEMDQLRDSINFRAFSQQDPRIEYKREGSRLFAQMNQGIRDKVTDYIFKARLAAPPPPPQRRAPGGDGGGLYTPPSGAGGTIGGIAGPGIAAPAAAASASGGQAPPTDAPEDEPDGADSENQAAREAAARDRRKPRKR